MIAALRGTVQEKSLDEAIIDVGGVGYRVFFSTLTLGRLPPEGEPVQVRVRTVVREDAFELFGFLSRAEEELFLLLNSVSHVGPRLALAVLSGMEVPELVAALGRGEVARLTKIHGVGKKTAERLVLELKGKDIAVFAPEPANLGDGGGGGGPYMEAREALAGLGYSLEEAEKALNNIPPQDTVEKYIKEALRRIGSRR
jgi:holliday junction DNA helicase RuvA